MNPDQIHDALNLLDDNMIANVETLRSRKRTPWSAWIRWSCAACACVAAICTFTVWKLGFFPFASQYSDGNLSQDYCDSLVSYTVLVEIQAWQTNGFSALITDASDVPPTTITSGETVTVLFSEYAEIAPTPADFPPGTVVCIWFSKQETVDNPETGTEHILYAKIILPQSRD